VSRVGKKMKRTQSIKATTEMKTEMRPTTRGESVFVGNPMLHGRSVRKRFWVLLHVNVPRRGPACFERSITYAEPITANVDLHEFLLWEREIFLDTNTW